MRALFSSDLHALKPAFELFARKLKRGRYDAGILAGDLLDDFWLPDEILMRVIGASSDDILEELPEEEDPKPWKTAVAAREILNARAMLGIEQDLKRILSSAGKPVFLIPGNHDTTAWADSGNVVNIHGRRVELGPWNFVGYRWTALDEPPTAGAELEALARLVDSRTVLVPHDAPRGAGYKDYLGAPLGNPAFDEIARIRRPAWQLYGHIHSGFGAWGRSVNGAYPNSRSFYDLDLDRGRARIVRAPVAVSDRMEGL
jgi:Icc-related predicted phosphoesterase